jgi:hypothetical protein
MNIVQKPVLWLMLLVSLFMALAGSQAAAASKSQSGPGFSLVFPYPLVAGKARSGEGIASSMPEHLRRQMERSFAPLSGRKLSSSAYRCRPQYWHDGWEYKSLAGQFVGLWLWRYYQQVAYCVNGRLVTYFYRWRWYEINSVTPYAEWKPWQFVAHVGSNCVGEHCAKKPYRAPERTAWTKGEFQVCLIAGNFCNHATGQVWITVFGDGTVISRASA